MIGIDKTQSMRAIAGGSVLALLLVAATCAAPDAQPGDDIVEPPPSDASDASDASDTSDASDAPTEPVAGDPTWRAGFGESSNDQRTWDVAFDPKDKSIVSTMGFIVGISIPGLNSEKPYVSGPVVPVMPTPKVQNILVVKQAVETGTGSWATQIYNAGEVTRSIVDVDKDSNVVVAGGFGSTLEILDKPSVVTKGSYDAFIVKLDPAGKPIWVHTFGGTAPDYVTDVATDSAGNIVVVGFAASTSVDFGDGKPAPSLSGKDIFIAKFAPDGKVIWAKRVGEAGATDSTNVPNWREPTVTVDVSRDNDTIVVGGTYRGMLNFSPENIMPVAGEDGFVVKLGADGKGLWHVPFGGANGKQRVRSVAIGAQGEVFLTGAVQGSVNFAGTTLNSVKGSQDLLVAKLNAEGKPQWVRSYGSLGRQLGTKIIADEKGSVFVGGHFTGSIDFSGNDSLTNGTKEDATTPTDIFVSKMNAGGTPLWAHAFGDANPAMSVGIQTIEGGVLWNKGQNDAFITFGGVNSGSVDFSGKLELLQSVGLEDAYLMTITY